MITYIVITTIFNLIVSIIWKSDDIVNLVIKFLFISMTFFGAVIIFQYIQPIVLSNGL